MKKVFVINSLDWGTGHCCCWHPIKKPNWFKILTSDKAKEEKDLSDKFNAISKEGFSFLDEKVLPHNLYIDNEFIETAFHGVYRFTESGPTRYQVYFGPLIDAGSLQGEGCKLGCKGLSCKGGIGCRTKGGDTQYVNYMNDELNESVVKKLNSIFGLRKTYSKDSDHVYVAVDQESLNEFVKEHYEQILAKYNQDVQAFYNQGLGYVKTIDVPSHRDFYSQAMLFGSNSNQQPKMADLSEFSANITLSRFDIWYFPMVKGLIRQLLEKIPFMPKKKSEAIKTSYIEDKNLKRITEVYTEEFNAQEQTETINKYVQDNINLMGKIPVTIAVRRKLGFWSRLFSDIEYDFYTYLVDAIKE